MTDTAAGPPAVRFTKAAVNDHVSAYLTPKGVRMWWHHPAWQLGEQTPAEAWEQGRKREVYAYALGGRDMGGT